MTATALTHDEARFQEQEAFRKFCRASNNIEAVLADCSLQVVYAQSQGGRVLEKAKERYGIARLVLREREMSRSVA